MPSEADGPDPDDPMGRLPYFEESYVFRDDRQRWLYTGVTRASDKIIVVS